MFVAPNIRLLGSALTRAQTPKGLGFRVQSYTVKAPVSEPSDEATETLNSAHKL